MSNNLRHTYRAHFRPNGHYTLNEGSFIGNSLQHPYCEQPIYGVKMYDQNQPPSLPSVPFVNAYSLTTNTHGVPASTARSDFNGLPYMGYSDQANHNGLRQLAVPPLPAPSSTASYAAQSFHQTPTSLELTPFISATIPKPSDTHGDSRGPECDVENANHTAPASSDLEDGELNDEALQAPIDQSTAISRTDSRIMYHQQPQNADSVVGKSRKSNATLHKPLPGLAQGIQAQPLNLAVQFAV